MSLFLIERTMRTHVYLRAMLTTEMLRMIDWSLQEDLGECDHTSASSLPEGLQREGWILAKEEGVVAGLEVASQYFSDNIVKEAKLSKLLFWGREGWFG